MSSKETPKKSKRQVMKEKRVQEARRKRMIVIAVIVGVALILVAAVALPAIQDANAPVGEFVQITPESYPTPDGRMMGDPNAPVTIEVYEDFKCSACQGYSQTIEPQVISELVETGTVFYVFRQYPFLDDRSNVKDSDNAANASMCAADQGHFWDYKKMLYANLNFKPGEFSEKRLLAFAESMGLDMDAFGSCLDGRTHQSVIDEEINMGISAGVTGTPSIFVNGQQVKPGYVPTFEEILAAVNAAQ